MSAPVNFPQLQSSTVLFTSVADANAFFGSFNVSAATTATPGVVSMAILPGNATADVNSLATTLNALLAAMKASGQGQ